MRKDGQMDGRMDGHTDGWMDEQMEGESEETEGVFCLNISVDTEALK